LLTTLLLLTSVFLILLILVQRGKGGGLVGALGGMGGQSAFGAKAGGIFWATSVAAGVWILLCVAAVMYNSASNNAFAAATGANAKQLEDAPSSIESVPDKKGAAETPATGTPATGTATPGTSTDKPATKGEADSEKDFSEETPAGNSGTSK
jgi:preprotein translocase subunit SecG